MVAAVISFVMFGAVMFLLSCFGCALALAAWSKDTDRRARQLRAGRRPW